MTVKGRCEWFVILLVWMLFLGRGREFVIFVGRCMCKDTDRYLSW